MYKALIDTIAVHSSCSTDELEQALDMLNSIDALIVSIECAYVTQRPFMDVVHDIQSGWQVEGNENQHSSSAQYTVK